MLQKEPSQRPQDARTVLESVHRSRIRLDARKEQLREAALALQRRQSEQDAAQQTETLRRKAIGERNDHAIAELHSALDDVVDLANEALAEPPVELVQRALIWELAWSQARLVVDLWTERPKRAGPGPACSRGRGQYHRVRDDSHRECRL